MANHGTTAFGASGIIGRETYIPEKHIHAPVFGPDNYSFLNDPQPPVYDEETKKWRAWYLRNTDADVSGKTAGNNAFVNGGTEWYEISSADLKNWENEGVRLPKGRQNTAAGTADYFTPSIMSGCCILNPKRGADNEVKDCADNVLYFASIDGATGGRSIGLWTAAKLGESPVYQGIVLERSNEEIFRDPRIAIRNGAFIMAVAACGASIAGGKDYGYGVSFYKSADGRNWTPLSHLVIGDMGVIECPQLVLDIGGSGKDMLLWCGNAYAHGSATGTYATLGRFDGAFFTPENGYDFPHDRLDYGADWYAGVVFGKDNRTYCLGWLNNWDYAANLPCPDFNGALGIKKLEQRGARFALAPLPALPECYKKTLRHDDIVYQGDTLALKFNGNAQDFPVLNLPDSCLCHFFMEEEMQKGESIAITHGTGNGAILRKAAEGFVFCRRDYGARPYYGLDKWQREYFIPAAGGGTDIWLQKDKSSLEIFVNGASASFVVLYPLGSPILQLRFNPGHKIKGGFEMFYDRFPAPSSAILQKAAA